MEITCQQALSKTGCEQIAQAINLYSESKFKEAHLAVKAYMQKFGAKARKDILEVNNKKCDILSFIVVTTVNEGESGREEKLERCLKSIIEQKHSNIEIIILFNGCEISRHIFALLKSAKTFQRNIKVYKLPTNTFPSEARNLGACAASSEWIVFIDDDGYIAHDYTKSLTQLLGNYNFLDCRGKVVPIDKSIVTPEHYDLGDDLKSCELNIEGNLVINKNLFGALCGFNPLMYAHEGRNLYARCLEIVDAKYFIYTPNLILHHDPSLGIKSDAKIKRTKIADDYLMQTKLLGAPQSTKIKLSIIITGKSANIHLASILHDLTYKDRAKFCLDVIVLTHNAENSLRVSGNYRAILNIKVLASPKTAINYIQKKAIPLE